MDKIIEIISGFLPSSGVGEGDIYSAAIKYSWLIALLIVVGGGIFIISRVGEAVNGILSSAPAKLVGFIVVVGIAILFFK